jgi:hypothetical protein
LRLAAADLEDVKAGITGAAREELDLRGFGHSIDQVLLRPNWSVSCPGV